MTRYLHISLIVVVWIIGAPGRGLTFDGNRLAYLDDRVAPYYVGRKFPKLVTPQWVGEPGVEAVVVLAIDDMMDTEPYENYLRPILDRLKQIDGRAPVSIMTCEVDPRDERLQQWITEGVSLEAHTIDHPCPLLRGGDFSLAKRSYELCIDMLASIPGNKPVAFRVPCCDSQNTPSPRFWKELFNDRTSAGNFLSIDSSVGNLFTPADTDLPLGLTRKEYGVERFRRYLPSPQYINVIENYPYPYVIAHRCWEFPYAVPSDWQAQNMQWSANPDTIQDLKLALDATVIKQGVMTLFFHPKKWMRNDQVVELIEYATKSYAGKVKFLNFRESLIRINQHLLAGQPLRDARGDDNGVRLLDVNNDGYLDVFIANNEMRQTRIWSPTDRQWEIKSFPVTLRESGPDGVVRLRFGVLGPDGQATCIGPRRGWSYRDGDWQQDPTLFRGVSTQGENDTDPSLVRLRDLDGDGCCEWLDANRGFVYRRDQRTQQWRRLPYKIPNPGWSRVMDAGAYIADREDGDTGLRFVDIDQDGDQDVLFSNPLRCGLYLFESLESGWVTSVVDVSRGNVEDVSIFPSIVRPDGTDNGSWFHRGQLVFQNEDTYRSPQLVERTSLHAVLEQYRQRMLVKQRPTQGRRYVTDLRSVVEPLVKIALLLGSLMTGAAYLVLLERRVAAWIQDRRGPNRVGVPLSLINSKWADLRLFGLGQPLADGLKFVFKEEFTPAHVDRKLFVLAPVIILTTALAVFAVIPFGSMVPSSFDSEKVFDHQIGMVVAPGLDVGMIFVFALSSVAVYGVILGGWSSNNKYGFLGGLRSSAQLIAYELPLGLGLLGVVLAAGSLNLETIIERQALHGWYAVTQPLGFFVFLVAAFAESARLPFDLPECEQELIGGYHTEYSGIKLLLFLVAEFLHMVTMAFLIVILFLGGWHLPFEITGSTELIDGWGNNSIGYAWLQAVVRILVLMSKVMVVIVFFMLVRWSWPRFRFDQLMALAWKVMLPLGVINFVVVSVIEELQIQGGLYGWTIPAWLSIPLAWLVAVAAWASVSHFVSRIADNQPHRKLRPNAVDSAI